MLLLIGFIFSSCRNGNDGEETDSDSNSNSEQVNNEPITDDDNAISSNKSQSEGTTIAEGESGVTSPNLPEGNKAPITLDCNYFRENPNTVLKDNLEASVDYIITCVTRIDGKLTINPGVVIAFEQDAGLEFNDKSSFKMEGTAKKPIILTGKEQIKGFWRGIQTESPSPNNAMTYVTIDYAGGGNSKAALGIHREISNLTMKHCTFSNSKNYGIVVNDKAGKDVHNIIMKNCTFTKNNIPFKTNVTRLKMFNSTNSFSGNTKDYIYLEGGSIHGDATWAKLDVPYFLQDNFNYKDGVLSVKPGTEIIMPAQSWMHVSNKASLIMLGTAEEPIIIRGEHDVPGFWNQLTIDSSSPLNEIGHVIFKNAGPTTGMPNGAVRLNRSKYLNIHDVVFSDCFENGISLRYGSTPFYLKHANLSLDNTSKLFSDWKGTEVIDPDNT